ncbi:unnamed protein product [Paramecium sonneborni]|uniref:Uncharacterized protein n=1 Tax=Paramecium sonneborni TaxID=65129 RepID=A0A8S1NMK3_9CILI|nr:unnamed protein product [Paramecium sonneborni]
MRLKGNSTIPNRMKPKFDYFWVSPKKDAPDIISSEFEIKQYFNKQQISKIFRFLNVQTRLIPSTPNNPKERERQIAQYSIVQYRAPEMLVKKQYYSCEIDSWFQQKGFKDPYVYQQSQNQVQDLLIFWNIRRFYSIVWFEFQK